jgi:tripeptide aminopeptidase
MSIEPSARDLFLREQILARFTRYAAITTTSDRHSSSAPTTPGQWDLIRLLENELKQLGIADVVVDECGFLIARIPANQAAAGAAGIGLMAHVDTAADVSGRDVKPLVHRDYDGGTIVLSSGVSLSPEEFPALKKYTGDTLISSDGTTLLGADDKAGLAEIMAAAAWLLGHPEIPRPPLEIIFTPDEETGRGMDRFPLGRLRSAVCYTFDGDSEGNVEAECFCAYKAEVTFTGRVIHTGQARGKLVNALSMAGAFLAAVPRNESPEASDGRYGFYVPIEMKGSLGLASIEFLLRDFELAEVLRRIEALKLIGRAVEAAFPGGKIEVRESKQYLNMRDAFGGRPEILSRLDEAIRKSGLEPKHEIIRGGTDGSRLSEMGVPTPNVFAGGHNFHSRQEWVPLSAMVRAATVIIHLAEAWSQQA